MSVPFMLSIDYLNINAHQRLPPTRLGLRVSGYACACYALTGRAGFGYYFFTLPQGFRLRPAGYAETGTPWAIELTAPPVGGAQNSARLRLAKFQFSEFLEAPNSHSSIVNPVKFQFIASPRAAAPQKNLLRNAAGF